MGLKAILNRVCPPPGLVYARIRRERPGRWTSGTASRAMCERAPIAGRRAPAGAKRLRAATADRRSASSSCRCRPAHLLRPRGVAGPQPARRQSASGACPVGRFPASEADGGRGRRPKRSLTGRRPCSSDLRRVLPSEPCARGGRRHLPAMRECRSSCAIAHLGSIRQGLP